MYSSLLKVAQTTKPMYDEESSVRGNGVAPPSSPRLSSKNQTQQWPLDVLLELDRRFTRQMQVYKGDWVWKACLLLEWSGHGVFWFVICGLILFAYYLSSHPPYYSLGTDILALLLMDIVTVAPIKLVFKRPRPPANSGTIFLSVSSVDHYAFPSGHASRALALAAYFSYPPHVPVLLPFIWCGWALLVSLSRVVGGRHHLLDVLVGMVAGITVFWVTEYLGLLSL